MECIEGKKIDWVLKYECDYNCPYCPYYEKWNNVDYFATTFSIEKWLEIWKEVSEKRGELNLNIKGGNPFLYPGFIKLVAQLSRFCNINVRSNLSFDMEITSNLASKKINIMPFFHPLYDNTRGFTKKVKYLSQNGFESKVFYIGYSKQLNQFDYYKSKFNDEGIQCVLVPVEEIKEEKKLLYEDNVFKDNIKEINFNKSSFSYVTPQGEVVKDKKFDLDLKKGDKRVCYLNNEDQKSNVTKEKKYKKRDIVPELTWFFWHKCNYRCSYCFYNGEWEAQDSYFENLSLEEILRTWDKIYEKFGKCDIGLAGAEPTVYPEFFNLVKSLIREHKVNFNTNLSLKEKEIKKIITKLDSSKMIITCSFHPEFSDIEKFINKVSMLKEADFLSGQEVVCVGWPPMLEDIVDYKKIFSQNGINFRIQPFNGKYKGKDYPTAYTEGDKKLIYSLTKDQSKENEQYVCYQIGDMNPKGKLCRAGQIRAEIGGNGTVYRCSQCKSEPLGNFLNADFELLNSALPCESTYCPCDFKYLVEYD